MRRVLMAAAMVMCTLEAASCRQVTGTEPPKILYGQQECARCRMIISEERFACALVLKQNDGIFRSAVFDDINCMLEFEQEQHAESVVVRYVHDFNTHLWINASQAWYVHSDAIHTPMASGIVAMKSQSDAASFQRDHDGSAPMDEPAMRTRVMQMGRSDSGVK